MFEAVKFRSRRKQSIWLGLRSESEECLPIHLSIHQSVRGASISIKQHDDDHFCLFQLRHCRLSSPILASIKRGTFLIFYFMILKCFVKWRGRRGWGEMWKFQKQFVFSVLLLPPCTIHNTQHRKKKLLFIVVIMEGERRRGEREIFTNTQKEKGKRKPWEKYQWKPCEREKNESRKKYTAKATFIFSFKFFRTLNIFPLSLSCSLSHLLFIFMYLDIEIVLQRSHSRFYCPKWADEWTRGREIFITPK